tara:strand:- start:22270 stop:22959 length:690 start_codon:yes stop_codon:yes gene_type:complete
MEWQPSPKQLKQFIKLQSILKFWNDQVNLTRLIDGNDFWINQVFDSLWPLKSKLRNQQEDLNCIDVGSGCGFPGLAIAIALPQTKVTLIDSNSRKTSVLTKIAKELEINWRISIWTERVESFAHKSSFRGEFDLAIARAVAHAPVVAEYLVPLLNGEGEALIYRGKWSNRDAIELNKALLLLNSKIKKIANIKLPDNRGERNVIHIEPNGECPKRYPRAIGIPSKRPLR